MSSAMSSVIYRPLSKGAINGWTKKFRDIGVRGNDEVDLITSFVLDFARAKIWINDFYELTGLAIVVQFDLERALRKVTGRTLREFQYNQAVSRNGHLHVFNLFFFVCDASTIPGLRKRNGTNIYVRIVTRLMPRKAKHRTNIV
jgi:hypothetical protein